jgi:hypothetical protein
MLLLKLANLRFITTLPLEQRPVVETLTVTITILSAIIRLSQIIPYMNVTKESFKGFSSESNLSCHSLRASCDSVLLLDTCNRLSCYHIKQADFSPAMFKSKLTLMRQKEIRVWSLVFLSLRLVELYVWSSYKKLSTAKTDVLLVHSKCFVVSKSLCCSWPLKGLCLPKLRGKVN